MHYETWWRAGIAFEGLRYVWIIGPTLEGGLCGLLWGLDGHIQWTYEVN